VLGLPLTGRSYEILRAIEDGDAHVSHHSFLLLADLLVLHMGIIHPVLEIFLEAK
jgi:hypothetical protein